MAQVARLAVGFALVLAACGSTSKKQPAGPAPCPVGTDCPSDCTPGAKFCFERQIWQCAKDGHDAASIESCAAGEDCQITGKVIQCEASCEGSDCAPTLCKPGEKQCQKGDVYLCSLDGNGFQLSESCGSAAVCDPFLLSCKPLPCEPGARGCNGTVVTECDETGVSYEDTKRNCADDEQVCFQGECVAAECTPGTSFCQDATVYVCGSDGLDQMALQTCQLGSHCREANGMASCQPDTCQPGAGLCDLNVLKTCTAEGFVPDDGDDCGDEVCDNAACRPKVCEVGKHLCVDGNVHDCLGQGTLIQLYRQCADGLHCADIGDTGEIVDCVAQTCTPGKPACIGNVTGTCDELGSSLSAAEQNCALTSQVCSSAGVCAASTVDILGVATDVELITSGGVYGNLVDVHSNRVLTKLEANLLLDVSRDLRWVVYDFNGNTFEQIFTAITANNVGSGFFGAPALDLELEAGHRYFFGVGVVVGEGHLYFDSPPLSRITSFGAVVGKSSGNFDATYPYEVDGANLYRFRFTTELP